MLTDLAIRRLKPSDKPTKHFDQFGLHILLSPTGSKLWRLKYRYGGKEKQLSFGRYPLITLAEARAMMQQALTDLAHGIDPGTAKKKAATSKRTFEAVAEEWLGNSKQLAQPTIRKRTGLLSNHINPIIGGKPINTIGIDDIMIAIRRVEAGGAVDTAHAVLAVMRQVFQHAVVLGLIGSNPCSGLSSALVKYKAKHRAAITDPADLAVAVKQIWAYDRSATVKTALRLQVMLACRPGELRHMEWAEIDLDKSEWSIPAEKMKMREPHLVPLPHQAVKLLRALQDYSGRGRYVFPNPRAPRGDRPMSENAVLVALRSMGFEKDEVTGHGFRATFRTILDEVLEERVDLIEQQLAHMVRDPLGRAYNRTKFIDQRRAMMQRWADYLDGLLDAECP